MAGRAALVTGGSSGIGLAIARALGEDGYGVTVSARRPDKLEAAAEELRGRRASRSRPCRRTCASEDDIKRVVDGAPGALRAPRRARSTTRASGIGGAIADAETKKLDMQLDVNLRARLPDAARVHPDAQGGGRRARQGADGEHRVDRRQARPGLARRLLGDEGGGGRASAGGPQGARRATASR